MANDEHVKIIKQGVEAWNRWREENPEIWPDLIDAHLSGERLSGSNLTNANLSCALLYYTDLIKANLRSADLGDAHLAGAKLTGANLTGAYLTGADLAGADLTTVSLKGASLRRANLSNANLLAANFTRAYLQYADFTNTIMDETVFANTDLILAKGLDSVRHNGPSYISIDTLYRSGGNIPESFLRGCGMPDHFITFIPSLIGALEPIQFYSCFISYSTKNQDFAERLHTDLQAKHVRCWFAPEDLKIGDRFNERIEDSIRIYDKLLIILSEESISSRWVEREVNAAFEHEQKQNRTMLFPIRLDDAVMDCNQAWAADIRRSRHIGDFTGWKDHDSYQKAFARLMRDLKAESSTPIA
jgi:hypothetical protein